MLQKAMKYGLIVSAIGFSLGFFGPMLLNPTSGNGLLPGIFITGPGGGLIGAVAGVLRDLISPRAKSYL